MHVGGKVRQQTREQGEGLLRVQLVEVVDDHHEGAVMVGELRQHPVDHRPPVELRRRCWRFRLAGCAGGMTDRVEQGKPELLGVVLVALHLQHGEPMRLTRTVGPRAQQRRLPAAGGSRDDRHLPRRRAIQGSKKITPVDQPGSCPIHLEMPALLPAPDARSAGDRVLSVSGQRTHCQRRESPGSGGDLSPAGRPCGSLTRLGKERV